jgi:hypothetical protein
MPGVVRAQHVTSYESPRSVDLGVEPSKDGSHVYLLSINLALSSRFMLITLTITRSQTKGLKHSHFTN